MNVTGKHIDPAEDTRAVLEPLVIMEAADLRLFDLSDQRSRHCHVTK